MNDTITIEVVYATPKQQTQVQLILPTNACIAEAIAASGLLALFPEIELTHHRVGIFGKLAKLDSLLRDRDRVEIYRPLVADPKEVRRQRAAQGKTRST